MPFLKSSVRVVHHHAGSLFDGFRPLNRMPQRARFPRLFSQITRPSQKQIGRNSRIHHLALRFPPVFPGILRQSPLTPEPRRPLLVKP